MVKTAKTMMKKLPLSLLFVLFIVPLHAQYFRLTYHVAACAGNPLATATAIYLYAGAGTVSPTSTNDYIAGTLSGTDLPLQNMGNNNWEICFDPYAIFKDPSNNQLRPMGTLIYNFTVNFRNLAGSAFAGQCGSNSPIKINNPMSSPQSLFPNIITPVDVTTCVVDLNQINGNEILFNQYPNPMNENGSTFQFIIDHLTTTSLKITNVLGKTIRTLINNEQLSGLQIVPFDGRDEDGNTLANGLYFYSLTLNGTIIRTSRLLITK